MEIVYHGKLHPKGRLVLPIELRRDLGLKDNESLVFRKEGNSIRILPFESALRDVQDWIRESVPEGVNLVDELEQLRLENRAAEDLQQHLSGQVGRD